MKVFILLICVSVISSCGTTKGVLYGAGTVLEGVASDMRSAGGLFE